jgi:hypothetical protein
MSKRLRSDNIQLRSKRLVSAKEYILEFDESKTHCDKREHKHDNRVNVRSYNRKPTCTARRRKGCTKKHRFSTGNQYAKKCSTTTAVSNDCNIDSETSVQHHTATAIEDDTTIPDEDSSPAAPNEDNSQIKSTAKTSKPSLVRYSPGRFRRIFKEKNGILKAPGPDGSVGSIVALRPAKKK